MAHTFTDAWQIIQPSLAALLPLQIQDSHTPSSDTDRDGSDRIRRYVQECHTRATELHTELLQIACFDWHRHHPNVPLDITEVQHTWHQVHGTTIFNYDEVIAYLDETFLPEAESRAYLAIREQAKTLIPHPFARPLLPISEQHRLLKGTTLTLHCELERNHHPSTTRRLPFGREKSLIALWQFAKITLDEADPAHVAISSSITHYLYAQRDDVTANSWHIPPITLRFFKNGRLDVTFTSAAHATLFLTALLSNTNTTPPCSA